MSRERALKLSLVAALALIPLEAGCIPDLSGLSQGEHDSDLDTAGAPVISAGSGGQQQQLGGGGGGATGGSAGAGASAGSPVESGTGGSSGMSGTAGMAGSGGSAPVCVPSGVEHCDGADNDCNGVIDDGCPSGVSTVFQEDLPTVGDSFGGSAFTEDCKDGEVLIGITLGVGGLISQVTGICGKVGLKLSADAPAGYEVTISQGSTMPPHPTTTTDTTMPLKCPENETIVGIRIGQQNNNDKVIIPKFWINCAKLVLSHDANGYSIDWTGMQQMAPVTGGLANDMAWYEDSAIPAGHATTRLLGASGAWLDRIGLGISKLTVAVVQ